MSRLCSFFMIATIVVFLNIAAPARGGDSLPKVGKLKVNVIKNIVAEMPGSEVKDGEKPKPYRLHVFVIGSEMIDGRDCWKAQIVPADQFQPEAKHWLMIVWDKETGWPRKVNPVKTNLEPKIQKVGDATFIVDGPAGLPIDMLPMVPPGEFKEGSASVKFKSTRFGDITVMELSYAVDGKEQFRVRQRWTDGQDWWRYYDKHVDGKLVLRARAFEAPHLDDPFTKVELEKTAPNDFAMRLDKRLNAFVQIEPNNPPVPHIVERIKEATGLDIELSPELKNHDPLLGQFQGGPKGFLAWQLMEVLRSREIDNGRWEKTTTGYRLHGVSKVFAKKMDPSIRQDPRLHAKVTLNMANPSVAEIFARIKDASGVELAVSPQLRDHRPQLGHIGSGACYNLMELLAEKDIENGRWEKTATGYRLTGISRAAAAPAPVAGDGPPVAAAPPVDRPFPWMLVITAGIFGVLLMFGFAMWVAWLLLRRPASGG